jgi:DNA-binding IclR family transcriptional regulator
MALRITALRITAMSGEREPGGHEPRAVQRALVLLEAVARLGSGATAQDISRLSGIPPATAYRLLNLLVANGYLVRIADLSGFALGRRTRELAGAAPDPAAEFRPAHVVVEELRARVRFGIFVASYADDRVRFVDRDPDHELTREDAIRAHLHASAVGKLLLAQRPQLVPAALRRFTARTITEPDALTAELSAIRASGVAREIDEIRVGRSALAVPVRDASSSVVGCIVAIGKTGRLGVEDAGLADLLRSYAERAAAHPSPR